MSSFQVSFSAPQGRCARLGVAAVICLVFAGVLGRAGTGASAFADELPASAPADAPRAAHGDQPTLTLPGDSIVHLLGGATWAQHQGTFALEVSYEKVLTNYFSLEGAYDNEGHLQDHHRDSLAIEIFLQRRLLNDRLRLRVGAGPELYFDTKTSASAAGNTDAHGIGLLGTLAAELELAHGIFLEGRVNGSATQADFSSLQALFGLGYHLGPPDQPDADTPPGKYLLFALAGESIRNSFGSETGAAVMAGVERQDIVACLGASAAYLRLGNLNGRQGAAVQLTAQERFFDNRFAIGAGVGPYVFVDSANDSSDVRVAGLVGVRLGYAVLANVEVLVSLMREFGHQDYDVVLAGLGLRL